MSEALVERLNAAEIALRDDRPYAAVAIGEAADRIEALEREVKERKTSYDQLLTSWAESRERHLAAEAREARLSKALRNIAEGNLGDAPWQANYDKIREVARAALSGSGSGWRTMAKPLDAWHEDDGFVTWWTWRDGQWLGEPSYIGSPLCSDWPGYHTHWTKHPDFPAAPQQGGE